MAVAKEWWRDFFSGMAVDLWLQATTDEQSRAEVDFIAENLQAPAGAKLLDLACGGGRHALGLASRGYALTGVDISPEFLKAAKAKASAAKLPISFEQRDMQNLPWASAFGGAYCFGNSFGYSDDAGSAACLLGVANALKSGGRFILDTGCVAELILPHLQENSWFPVGDILFLQSRHYDHREGRVVSDYTFIRNGQIEKKTAWHRAFPFRLLEQMLVAAGFSDIQAFGSLAREPFKLGVKRLLLIGTKSG